MSSIERLPFTQWADIHRAERFISIKPMSGYRRALPENEGYVIYLPPDASDDMLGRALVDALNRSRFIWPADEPEFFEWQRFTQCSRNWQNDFMKRYGYKTKRDAYKNTDWSRTVGNRRERPRCADEAQSSTAANSFTEISTYDPFERFNGNPVVRTFHFQARPLAAQEPLATPASCLPRLSVPAANRD